MTRAVDLATSFGATLATLGVGAFVGELGPRPAKTLELYEFEACPFCRKVREALSVLDLDALVQRGVVVRCRAHGRCWCAHGVGRVQGQARLLESPAFGCS